MKKIKALLAIFTIILGTFAFKINANAEGTAGTIPAWFDAVYYAQNNPDVYASAGMDSAALYWHYQNFGKFEGRRPSAVFANAGADAAADAAVTSGITNAADTNYIYFPTGVASNGSPYYILVDRTACITYVFAVGEDGTYSHLIRAMLCSVGREGHRTPVGNFKIYEHTAGGGWVYMADGTYAIWSMRFRTGGYMFHTVCFKNKGDALPIAEEVAALGSPASLGCVRLSVEDCKWLYQTVPDGTLVTIGN